MYIGDHARGRPGQPALINGATGETLTYRELDERANRLANLWYTHGLRRGDHVALFLENNIRFMEVCWAALRSGLYYTAVNRYLTADEAAYVVTDCGAKALVSSAARGEVAAALPALTPDCPSPTPEARSSVRPARSRAARHPESTSRSATA